jgi:hypothetical protein
MPMRVPRHSIVLLAMLGVASAVPALAQTGGSQYPAACDASKVSKGDSDRAHTVYLSGKQYLDESNYDKAISYFKDAYSIDCSVHAILPIIATAYERKGDKASAVGALEEYVKRAPQASDREVIERRIRNLKDQLAREQPTGPTATTPTTGTGTQPTATGTGTGTAPTATSTGTTAPTTTGTTTSTPSGGHSAAPWIVVGIGAAAAIAGGVLFGVGSGKVSTAETACPSDSTYGRPHACKPGTPQSVLDDGNTGRSMETIGLIAGGVGLAAVVGGLVWHFVEPTAPSEPAPTPGARVTPVVGPGYAGVGVGGRF